MARGPDRSAARRPGLGHTPIPLFLAALVPPAVVLPIRLLIFGDDSPVTLVLLGPAVEEGLKLAAVLLVLTIVGLVLPRGRDPRTALRYWLFLAPWFVGGFYGMMEGLLVYSGESSLDFTLREFAHGTFTAVALSVTLWVWQELDRGYAGVALGFGSGWSVHILFNLLALLSGFTGVSFGDQSGYVILVSVVAIATLARAVRHEPASSVTMRFLALPPPGLRT